jgi:ADP-heptose:LPS heptosyltransferase
MPPRQPVPPLQRFKYPAVIFGNALGDQLLALPALRALAAIFPSRLALICMPGFRRKFFSDLPLRSVCEITMRVRKGQRLFDSASVAKKIGKCDLLLSLNPWTSPSLRRLLRRLSPELSIGLLQPFEVILARSPTKHMMDTAFRVPAYLDLSLRCEDFAIPPRLPARVRPRIREFLKSVAPGKRVLAIHNETKHEKLWPPDRLGKLVNEFLRRHPDFVVFILDLARPRWHTATFADRIIHSYGLPLPYAFGLLRESELFLGVDSCLLHAADLFRVPGVGLFGPTDPRRWGFRFAHHHHIRDRRGLHHISPQRVLQALESLLRSTRHGKSKKAK